MCRAFSCIVTPKQALWQMGMDSHTALLEKYHLKDDTADPALMAFARVEIAPANGNYLNPDRWEYRLDQSITPAWYGEKHKAMAWAEHKKWLRQLDKILVHKPIVHPFEAKPPAKITAKHLALLAVWDSVWASVRDSVWASVGDSVWDSVRASVWASVRDSVGDSVRDSVGDSVGASVGASVRDSVGDSVWASVRAYCGSFFHLPRKSWLYTENIKTKGYPFQPAADLWEMGLVPSYDGKLWRLHGGPRAAVLWQGVIENGKGVAR